MRFLITILALIGTHWIAHAQESFFFEKTDIAPGTKEHFKIPVTDGKDSTFIPITVFQGLKSGPVLGITAGIHGYEYPPILAGQRIAECLDPTKLKGTVILVQVANVPAFLGRSPFLNPMDNQNLNRSFPGDSIGSITARIAHTITQKVIARSDFFVDMHGGDSPEDLMPYNAWYTSEALPKVSALGKEMALAMGFEYTIIFNIPKERLLQPSLYCSQEAFHRKIPAVDIECGRLGMKGVEESDIIVSAMFSLLSHLEMRAPNKHIKKTAIIVDKREAIKSQHSGIFYTDKKAGDRVVKGEKIGYITDFYGQKLEDIVADNSGIILYMIGTPPINKGETLMNVGLAD